MKSNRDWAIAILQGMAGASPSAFFQGLDDQEKYSIREDMKALATERITEIRSRSVHSLFCAPWWLLHAYAHWWRAHEVLDEMDSEEFDQCFESGMDFKKYLAAWLWSIGIPRLKMTQCDLEGVHNTCGVGPMPNALLPPGHSYFLTGIFVTTNVMKIPACELSKATVETAFDKSRVDAPAE